MSSILKALKKIDEDSSIPQTHPSLPKAIDAKKAVSSEVKKRWYVHRSVTVGLILLFVVVIAVILFSQRGFFIAKTTPSGVEQKKNDTKAAPTKKSGVFKSKIATPSKKQTSRLPQNKRPLEQQNIAVNTGNADTKSRTSVRTVDPTAGVGQRKSKVNPLARTTRPGVEDILKKPSQQKSLLRTPPANRKSIAARRTAVTKPPVKAKKPSSVKTYDRIDRSKLKLQALAWFDEAAKRMAVINNRVVREGESVDGYQITQIRQEDVVVNDGRKSWSLVFGLK